MIRKIIHIDEEKCNGCGLCAEACHEGAIDIIDGKAKLVREHFCDGFGDCLPNCPTGAITFEEREAPAYDAEAVKASQTAQVHEARAKEGQMPQVHEARAKEEQMPQVHHAAGHGCPGSRFMSLGNETGVPSRQAVAQSRQADVPSRLAQWPCQIKLLPAKAPFYDGAKLLIAADCTAYAYANMHEAFMKGKVTLIGCPKLDAVDYSEKLTEIIRDNDIRSVTIVRMEVPCCGGLEYAAKKAIQNSGKFLPWQVVTISRDGRILD